MSQLKINQDNPRMKFLA